MAEKSRLNICAGLLLFAFLSCASHADDCKDQCTAPCSALKCNMLAPVLGGCWFDGADCWSCTGEKAVTTCEQYGEDSCEYNTCGIPYQCKWMMNACLSTGVSQPNCKTKGCSFSYKCMADGECVHFSVSTQAYCANVYTGHGFAYDPGDSASCEKVGDICKKTDEKCIELSNSASTSAQRKNECTSLKQMCLECQGDCELRRSVSSIENIIYGTAAGLAVLLLAINGIRLMSAEDSLSRSNAKKGIAYVILSLLVILIAVKFIEYVWISFTA
ncbi:MAG: hypothetical protein WAX07_07780 [Candidatus Altiarchaeia archaeon]